MTDREKIIRDFENCAIENGCVNCNHNNCIVFWRNVLALLKEQEAVEPKIFQSEDFLWSHWYICGACEYPVDPGDKFCRKCGRPIKWEEDSDSDEN